MILDKLPDILNMVIRRIEKFLEAFKKFGFLKIHSQNRVGEVQGYDSKSLFFEGEIFFKGL